MILMLGDTTRPEFSEARKAMESIGVVATAPDIAAAEDMLADGETIVEAIVVAQACPGEFSADQIDRLRRRAPLVPIVALLGAWCEGEMRSGHPWPGATRVYWHQFPARCAEELPRLLRGLNSSWSLPPTAGEDERVLALSEQPLPRGTGRVAIYSREYEMYRWLAAACGRQGFSAAWVRQGEPIEVENASAVIFDGTEFHGDELDWLRALAARFAPVPLIALVNFPRVEDRERILAAGATVVLSKPVLMEDLLGELGRVARR